MAEKEGLYIPYGLKNRKEFFPGFGKAELMKTAVVAIVAMAIGMVLYVATANLALVPIVGVIGAAIGVGLFTQDPTRQICIVDQVRQMVKFLRGQKVFDYRRLEEFEGVVEESLFYQGAELRTPERIEVKVADRWIPLPLTVEAWEARSRGDKIVAVTSTLWPSIPLPGDGELSTLNHLAMLHEQIPPATAENLRSMIDDNAETYEDAINIILAALYPPKKRKAQPPVFGGIDDIDPDLRLGGENKDE